MSVQSSMDNSDPLAPSEPNESFQDILSQFERTKTRKPGDADKGREGTVIAITADSVLVDIGFKTEGILPLSVFQNAGDAVKPGDKIAVSVKGRDPEGYYELTRGRIERPKDWASLEQAFADKATIVGTVTGVVKGGLSVDVGVRAFMPASRSGTRDAAELEKLVGQEIRCRIIKLDVSGGRRGGGPPRHCRRRRTLHERAPLLGDRGGRDRARDVRSLTDYGAFVDIGGVDALLHVSDIS